MYEENTKTKLEINWKSLLVKMAIVLVALFIILWLISLVNKDKNEIKPSNISTNLQIMVDGALDYFKDLHLPQTINGKKKITLGDMLDLHLISEFKDQNGEYCDNYSSYAEATKVNNTDYSIKVKLVCGEESDYIIKTIQSYSNVNDNDNLTDEDDENSNNSVNNINNNTNTNSTQNNTSTTTPSTSTTTPSTSTTKPNTNTTSKPSVTVKPSVTTTCTYGKKEYSVSYPLAYVVSGDCAVSNAVLNYATHSNAASTIGATEYKKLYLEIQELNNKTGANLIVESPRYIEVQNKDKKGYVGYQIKFVVKQNNNIIYEYYLDTNGNRTVITDSRNNISYNIKVNSVEINSSNLNLSEGEYNYLDVTIKPSNATNKDITWSSSNNKIVKVTSNGKITALKEGKAYITATVDGLSDKILVTVYKKTVNVESVEINSDDLELYTEDNKNLTVSINPSNATNKDITWSSSNNKIVKVNSNGKITALKESKAYITATVDGVSDKILVTVYENETYTYCKRVEERIYSTGFAGKVDIENKSSLNYSYTLDFERRNIEDLKVVDYGNLTNTLSEYKKAYNYLTSYRKPIEIVNNDSGVDPISGQNLKDTSFKSSNMTPIVSYLYNRGNSYYFNVNIRLYNLYNIRDAYKHYTSEDYWVYFVPLYFDIEYTDLNDCKQVNAKDEHLYENNKNYIKVS